MAGGLKRLRRELLLAAPHLERAAGESASFETDLIAPLKGCLLDVGYAQSGSGEPSPENPRPLTGRTGLTLTLSPTQDAQDGESLAVSWADEAGAVYGGSLDLTTGLLTETCGLWVYNETRAWKYSAGWSRTETACFYVSGQSLIYFPSYDYLSVVACDRFRPYSRNGLYGADAEGVSLSGTAGETRTGDFTLRISKARGVTDVDSLKAWLQSNPITVIYRRKTPLTWQLTSARVLTLRGTNRVFSDAGAVSLRYWTH